MNPEIPKGEALPDAPSNPSTGTEANQPNRVGLLKDVLFRVRKRDGQDVTSAEKPPLMLQFKFAHEKFSQRNPELVGTFDGIFKAFNSELLASSAMFETADGQASLPYSTINVTDFAKKIFKGNPLGEAVVPTQNLSGDPRSHKKERYYIVGSHLILGDGQFSYSEIAFHEFMKKLPAILKDLETGKEPVDLEIAMPGAPSSMFGHLTKEFADRVHANPTETYGTMFREFVENHLAKDQTDPQKTNITLHGFSMGSSWCAETARQIEGKDINVKVLMDSPTGLHGNREWPTRRRMDIGFAVDATIGLLAHPHMIYAFDEPLFWDKMTPYLKENNGYQVYLDPEEVKLKKEVIADTVEHLRQGIPVDKSVDAILRKGKKDLSITTVPFLLKSAKRQTQVNLSRVRTLAKTALAAVGMDMGEKGAKSGELANALTRDQLPGDEPRTFAMDSQHLYPFFRENEVRRWENTTRIIDQMIKRGQVQLPASIVSDKPFPYLARVKDIVSKKIGRKLP